MFIFFFSSRRRHTRSKRDWSSDVCSSDLFRRQAMIAIKTDGDLEKVAGQLADMEEIDYVVITAGSFDVLAEVVCEDDDHLLEILGRVRAVPFVTSTETFVYLKLRKQTYSWGTR